MTHTDRNIDSFLRQKLRSLDLNSLCPSIVTFRLLVQCVTEVWAPPQQMGNLLPCSESAMAGIANISSHCLFVSSWTHGPTAFQRQRRKSGTCPWTAAQSPQRDVDRFLLLTPVCRHREGLRGRRTPKRIACTFPPPRPVHWRL